MNACYAEDRTNGFVSSAPDAVEGLIDLSHTLDLKNPGRYRAHVLS
ncbi:hypothetical protein PY793_11470 [Acetobacter fabarum]